MKNSKSYISAFTLAETLIASSLSVIVVAMVMTLLVKNAGVWREGMARLHLSKESRIIRERVLHGIDGQFGLRHASRSQTVIEHDSITFRDIDSSNQMSLLWVTGQPPVCVTGEGVHNLARSDVVVENFAATFKDNIVNIDLSLAVSSGGRKYTQPQQIRVYLLND